MVPVNEVIQVILAVLPANHTCIHKQNNPYLPLFRSCRASLQLWLVLVSHPLRGGGGWVGLGGDVTMPSCQWSAL